MANQLYKNNASSTLAAPVAIGATTINLAAGQGARFPTPSGSDYFLITLYEKNGGGTEITYEVMKCTARTADALTVTRDFEGIVVAAGGTSGGWAFPSSVGINPSGVTYVELRYTAYAAGNNLTKDDNLASVGNVATARTNLGAEESAKKDASGGYAGLTLFKLNMRNVANTFTSWFTNTNTAARTYTLPDKDGTVAMISEVHDSSTKTPVDADELGVIDSAASWVQKKVTLTNFKAFLKTYFDGLYAPVGSTSTDDYRNKLRNPNFTVNQRVVSGTVTLAAGVYGHDGWKGGASGCTYTFSTSANVTTLTISAGSLQQIIEGTLLQTGTHTLSWTGTAQGKIGAGSYSATGVTGSATGGTNLTIEFNTGTLSKPQFEPGSTATTTEQRPTSMEWSFNQRYLPCTGAPLLTGQGYSTSAGYFGVEFPVETRVSVTGVTLTAALSSYYLTNATFSVTALTGGSLTWQYGSKKGAGFNAVATSGGPTSGQATTLYMTGGAQLLWTGAEL